MRRRNFWLIALLLAVSLSGCEQKADDGPIRIGLVAYLKGEQRELTGLDVLVASSMAVDEINSAGGVLVSGKRRPLELVVEEIDTNPEQAVNAVRSLINRENVIGIVGPFFSADAIPAGAVAEKSRIPLIAPPASHPDVTRGRKYVLRGTFLDAKQAAALASFVCEDLELRRATVVFDKTNSYSSGLAADFSKSFQRLGGEVVSSFGGFGEELFQDRLWKRLLAENPEVVFLPVYSPQSGKLADKVRSLGYTGQLLGGDAWDSRMDAMNPSMEGAIMSANFSRNLEMPATRRFVQEFKKRRDGPAGDSAALAYDAFHLIAKALEQSGKAESDALLKGLYELPPYFGVAGSIDFVDNGDPVKAVVIVELQGGDAKFRKFIVR